MSDTTEQTKDGLVKLHDNGDGTYSRVVDEIPDSANTSVERVSAGFMAPGQTAKQFTGMQALAAGATSITLYTVSTGKTFYITDINVVTDYPNGTGTLDCQVQAAGTSIFRTGVHNLVPAEMPGMETQPNAASATAVTLNIGAASTSYHVWWFISGFEQ
jgi:hypothetical protein